MNVAPKVWHDLLGDKEWIVEWIGGIHDGERFAVQPGSHYFTISRPVDPILARALTAPAFVEVDVMFHLHPSGTRLVAFWPKGWS